MSASATSSSSASAATSASTPSTNWAWNLLAGGAAGRRWWPALLALLLGLAILRLRGAYFALATIGINEAMKALVINIPALGGPNGMELNFSVYHGYGGPAKALWIVYWSVAAIALIVVITSYRGQEVQVRPGADGHPRGRGCGRGHGRGRAPRQDLGLRALGLLPRHSGRALLLQAGHHRAGQRLPSAHVHRDCW